MLKPRDDFLGWNDTWMALALLIAKRSKDPNTQVGACIIGQDNSRISVGYNGFPRKCNSRSLPWDREGEPIDTKYMYVCHAESNAIDNGDNEKMKDAKIYSTLYPCNECAKRIIQVGIKEVIYFSDKYHNTDSHKAARIMFEMADVKTTKYESELDEIVIKLKE